MTLHLLGVLFTLGALIFVFVVTYQTTGQSIPYPFKSSAGEDYLEYKWTPETWFEAILDLPLADMHKRDEIKSKVANMIAWRWMLIPILVANVIAFGITLLTWLRLR